MVESLALPAMKIFLAREGFCGAGPLTRRPTPWSASFAWGGQSWLHTDFQAASEGVRTA